MVDATARGRRPSGSPFTATTTTNDTSASRSEPPAINSTCRTTGSIAYRAARGRSRGLWTPNGAGFHHGAGLDQGPRLRGVGAWVTGVARPGSQVGRVPPTRRPGRPGEGFDEAAGVGDARSAAGPEGSPRTCSGARNAVVAGWRPGAVRRVA